MVTWWLNFSQFFSLLFFNLPDLTQKRSETYITKHTFLVRTNQPFSYLGKWVLWTPEYNCRQNLRRFLYKTRHDHTDQVCKDLCLNFNEREVWIPTWHIRWIQNSCDMDKNPIAWYETRAFGLSAKVSFFSLLNNLSHRNKVCPSRETRPSISGMS